MFISEAGTYHTLPMVSARVTKNHRHTRVLAVVVLLLAGLATPATSQPVEDGVAVREVTISSHDGVLIQATLFVAAGDNVPRPGLLTTHGWAGERADRADEAARYAEAGYHVLTYDSRGFGESGGFVTMNGPAEVADVSALIDWWVADAENDTTYDLALDGPGDPRIGMNGLSYGGAIQLLAAAADTRIDAIAPDITWNDLLHSLAPRGVVKRGWVDFLFWGGTLAASGVLGGNPNGNGLDPDLRNWYLEALHTGRFPDAARQPMLDRSPAYVLGDVQADVLLTQGWPDTLFDADEARRTFEGLAARPGVETSLIVHGGGHSSEHTPEARRALNEREEAFLGRHLMDLAIPVGAQVQALDMQTGLWVERDPWDVSTVKRTVVLGAHNPASVMVAQAPPPSTHTESQAVQVSGDVANVAVAPPTVTSLSLNFSGPAIVSGTPRLWVNATSILTDITVFAALVDVGPQGGRRVVDGQVAALRFTPVDDKFSIDLPLVSSYHHVASGHTLELRLATSDSAYYGARDAGVVAFDLRQARVLLPLAQDGVEVTAPVAAPPATADTVDSPALSFLWVIMATLAVLVAVRRRDVQS